MIKSVNPNVKTKIDWTRYLNKELIAFMVSVALALASVFLIGPWIDNVMILGWQAAGLNFAAAVTTAITFYVAKTHYSRGAMNVLRKIFWVTLGSLITVGLAIASTTVMGGVPSIVSLIYPLTGIFIVAVTFYMISLSSETLGILGMYGIAIFIASAIIGGAFYGHLDKDQAILASQLGLLFILAIGGVFAKWRMYLHGIRGVNNDGGFKSDEYGDAGDGDGDTGEE